jgi:hypothetical protein
MAAVAPSQTSSPFSRDLRFGRFGVRFTVTYNSAITEFE